MPDLLLATQTQAWKTCHVDFIQSSLIVPPSPLTLHFPPACTPRPSPALPACPATPPLCPVLPPPYAQQSPCPVAPHPEISLCPAISHPQTPPTAQHPHSPEGIQHQKIKFCAQYFKFCKILQFLSINKCGGSSMAVASLGHWVHGGGRAPCSLPPPLPS